MNLEKYLRENKKKGNVIFMTLLTIQENKVSLSIHPDKGKGSTFEEGEVTSLEVKGNQILPSSGYLYKKDI